MSSLIYMGLNIVFAVLLFHYTFPVIAQESDSLRTSQIEELTVRAYRSPDWKPVKVIDPEIIRQADANSLADLGMFIPGSKVQNNSRGETTLFIRGAGERQIMLFFDGVPLNVPWDNRIDLSNIPTNAVHQITVNKGIPSVIYGANSISGVVNVISMPATPGGLLRVSSSFGDNYSRFFSGMYSGGNNDITYQISVSHKKDDGFKLPAAFNHPDNPSARRINSRTNSFNMFNKFNYRYSVKGVIGLTASFIDSKKEVPPEIDIANPRYWRYPLWQRSHLGIRGEHVFSGGNHSKIEYLISGTYLNSKIDQYDDATFIGINDIERSNDAILNGRLIYSDMISRASILKVALNGFTTGHNEKILSEENADKRYSQSVMSIGAEYEYFLDKLTLLAGFSYDRSSMSVYHPNKLSNSIADYGFTNGIKYLVNASNIINISFGRKTRFPTLRESFSGALGRFIPNPDLRPETAFSVDTGLQGVYGNTELDLTLFLTYLHNGIVRESLPGRQFRRINKDVIRTYGIEVSSRYKLLKDLAIVFHVTYLSAMAKNESGVFADTLEYKPQIISSGNLIYNLSRDIVTVAEMTYRGQEYGLREGSPYFRRLPEYFLVNFRFSYTVDLTRDIKLELFARVNNIFDKLYYSQWGLPEAGRNYRGGITIEI